MATDSAEQFTVMRLEEMEAAWGGAFVRVRASLGVRAFGMQVSVLPPHSGDAYPEHDHLFDGQEEVYLLLAGSAELQLPGRTVALDRETFARVDPGARRRLRSGPDGARVLILGGLAGAAYEPAVNSALGGPELIGCPTASTSLIPDSPAPMLA